MQDIANDYAIALPSSFEYTCMSVCVQHLRPSTSHYNRHYMVLTLVFLRMESSFMTASRQRGEALFLHLHTQYNVLIIYILQTTLL